MASEHVLKEASDLYAGGVAANLDTLGLAGLEKPDDVALERVRGAGLGEQGNEVGMTVVEHTKNLFLCTASVYWSRGFIRL